jgi:hypothetical protein
MNIKKFLKVTFGFVFVLIISLRSAEAQANTGIDANSIKEITKEWIDVGVFEWSGKKGDLPILINILKGNDQTSLLNSSRTIHRMIAGVESGQPMRYIVATKPRTTSEKNKNVQIGASMYGISADGKYVFISKRLSKVELREIINMINDRS